MTCARLRLTVPDGTWIGDVSRAFPEAEFSVRATVPGTEAGHALVSVAGDDLDAVREEMRAHDALAEFTVLGRDDAELTVQLETTRPTLLKAASRSGMPIEPPVRIADGEAIVDVEGDHARLSGLARELEALDVGVDVVFIGSDRFSDTLLTETQEELLTAAIEEGYYDTPRRCTLTELAEAQDIAKSTCSEILQRAEEAVVKQFVGDAGDGPIVAP